MAIQIKVADNPYQEQLVTLNGNSLFLTISYNTRAGRWYFDIEDRNRLPLISGVKVLPKQNLIEGILTVHKVIKGGIFCVNTKTDTTEIHRGNFGTDKQYQLWYIDDAELKELNLI